MRANFPITENQVHLLESKTVVSVTDLKGNITYANPYFVEISGFAENELIGFPQNIVRHPDMPKEAFADMWATIKSGAPWRGIVKNRCKNGDYYWVLANVTPVLKDGVPVGYMSVRTKPSESDVEVAAKHYAELKRGNPGNLVLRQGQVIRSTLLQRIKHTLGLSLARQVNAVCGSVAAALLALTFWSIGLDLPLLFTIICVFAASLVALLWVVLRVNIANIQRALSLARQMAGGDLTSSVQTTSNNEVGKLLMALRQTNVNLYSIISDVRGNFSEMRAAAHAIASGNMNLSARTESQASSLEETASSMEELTNDVQQNLNSVVDANKLTGRATELAHNSGETVREMGITMDGISASSRRVLDITGIIDGIAFQTNILALNAAVEAARAGEHGRGFAVVATEVRQLAHRSAAAAKEIKSLIDVSLRNIDEGANLTKSAAANMEEVINAVTAVKEVMDQIALTTKGQAEGIVQVNQAIKHMDEITQKNAALVDNAAAAASGVAHQTEEISHALAVFQLGSLGSSTPSAISS